jgi:hypothetical protein
MSQLLPEFNVFYFFFTLILGGIVMYRFIRDAQHELGVGVFVAALVAGLQILLLLLVILVINYSFRAILQPSPLNNWLVFGLAFLVGVYVSKKANLLLRAVLEVKKN